MTSLPKVRPGNTGGGGSVVDHNDLPGLNVGDYMHLPKEKYDEVMAGTVVTEEELMKQFTLKLIESGDYTYIAEANPGSLETAAVWRVKRVEDVDDDIRILWADGNQNFDNLATDLPSLTYS